MDLTQVEGLRDLVESDTETQRKLAARQASVRELRSMRSRSIQADTSAAQGQMSKKFNAMRSRIIEASSLIEALIDFGEDEGISEGVFDQGRSHPSPLMGL